MDYVVLACEFLFAALIVNCQVHRRRRRAHLTTRCVEAELAASGRLSRVFRTLANNSFERHHFLEMGSTVQLTPQDLDDLAREWREAARATTPPDPPSPLGSPTPSSPRASAPGSAHAGRTEGPAPVAAADPDSVAATGYQRHIVDVAGILREGGGCDH